jgi:hypothetical protein|nr:MAG TPA: Protein of unknown function (DUF551) [Caudoviricetes sp.]
MKQTVEEAANNYLQKILESSDFEINFEEDNYDAGARDAILDVTERAYIAGAGWQAKQSPWISVEERLPEENENIIIMCKHGAIFNGTYCNGVWFCMDGYINDIYKDSPIYTSMSSIPPLWEPVAWFPIPSFDEILEANKDVLERIKEKGD